MDIVESDNLVKAFGKKRAVNSLTVNISENRITGIIGRNGAGKTTFLKLAAGFLHPTGGKIRVFGLNPFNNLAVSNNLIFVDESLVFPQTLNLGEIISVMPKFYPDFDLALALRLLDYFDLDKRQNTKNLSKGMLNTFNSIVGISARARLTIFDEPTSGMDAAVRKDFYRAVLKEYIAFPRTILLSSHLLGELSAVLEDIVIIDNGKLNSKMTLDEAETYAAGLRGSTEAVQRTAGGRKVLYREEFAPGNLFLAVKGCLTPSETAAAKENGVDLQPVHADDLCIYLTQRNAGGIDNALGRK